MHPHLARDMGQDTMAVGKLHPEGGVGKVLDNRSFDLDAFLLGHNLSCCVLCYYFY
ncbi:MAG: hypothetical protein A4E62_03181 [Syntrophorhabdus sp. PtaU1.Bin002]|nr:MAG: hypothetical protein A4E62_03181 [Syntrophorhabdus sp. PtaU1.Bin002]